MSSRVRSVELVIVYALAWCAACTPAPERPAEVSATDRVAYGAEFWKQPSGTLDQKSAFDVGDVVERVGHAFVNQPGHDPWTRSKRYIVTLDSLGIKLENAPQRQQDTAPSKPLVFRTTARLADSDGESGAWLQPWDVVGNTAQRPLQGNVDGIEHIEARADYVEVTWVLQRAPPSENDVEFSIDVSSDHVAQPSSHGVVLREAETVAKYRFSDAVAIDSAGTTIRIAGVPTASGLSYALPRAFIDSAVLPIAVDPLVSPAFDFELPGTVDDHGKTVAVASLPSGQALVAWRSETELGSISAARIDSAGNILDPTAIVVHDAIAWPAQNAVAVTTFNGQYLVGWVTAFDRLAQVGRIDSGGNVIDSTGVTVASNLAFDSPLSIACGLSQCAAAYNRTSSSGGYDLVVNLFDLVSAPGNGVVVANDSSQIAFDLATSGTRYAITWTIGGSSNLFAGFFSHAIASAGLANRQWSASTGTVRGSRVAWNGSSFGLAALNDTTSGVQVVFAGATPLGDTVVDFSALASPVGASSVDLAGKASGWLLAYADASKDIYARVVSPSGQAVGDAVRLSTTAHDAAASYVAAVGESPRVSQRLPKLGEWKPWDVRASFPQRCVSERFASFSRVSASKVLGGQQRCRSPASWAARRRRCVSGSCKPSAIAVNVLA